MPIREICSLLKSTVGLDVASVGEATVCRIVSSRMLAIECNSLSAYLSILKGSSREQQHLIDDITVPETWFFRDSQPFQLLSDYAINAWSPAYFGQKLNILSVPCSTGEEPYSIAMVLSDVGFSKDNYVIDAVDVSTRVLEVAKNGVYGNNSFRGSDTSFRDRYFEDEAGRYGIVERIKESVSFYHQNILSPRFMEGRGPYDIVFCRNLLIYFDLETKHKVLKKISDAMSPGGMLFLGHAETGRMVPELFESLCRPGTFAYKKTNYRESCGDKSNAPRVVSLVCEDGSPSVRLAASTRGNVFSINKFQVKDSQSNHVVDRLSIEDIQQLADAGRLGQAKEECVKYLDAKPESADGHCLLGVIKLALEDDKGAASSFKRSIYLDPNHYQSLIHLSILCEEQGDIQAATNYRARSGRAKESQRKV